MRLVPLPKSEIFYLKFFSQVVRKGGGLFFAFTFEDLNIPFLRSIMNSNETTGKHEELKAQITRLNQIGIALSSEHNLNKLLELIVKEARSFTDADGGSLYIREGDKLNFIVAQTESLECRSNAKPSFKSFYVPLTKASISGFVAVTGEVLNIPDVYHIPPTVEYRFNKDFDVKMDYRSKSMLTVPMRDHQDEIIGVLQLVNSMDKAEKVVPFKKEYELLILSLASQAAVAIRNANLIAEIKNLFRSLVHYSVKAIDSRSRHTAGHSSRVAKYSKRFAEAINEESDGRLGQIKFTPEQIEELHMCGLLHDIGKIGVKEAVLEKTTKLNDAQMEAVASRFEAIKASCVIHAMQQKLELAASSHNESARSQEIDMRLQNEIKKLEDDLTFLQRINDPIYNASSDDLKCLREIAERTYHDTAGEVRYFLTGTEYENLSVTRGNLTAAEYKEIQKHVDYSLAILDKIRFTKDLENIPRYAAAHHEYLNGSGYPRGLKGDEIPLQSRILCIADIYDALTAPDRPYKKAVPLEQSLKILQDEAGRGRLDADLIDLFIRRKLYEGLRKTEEKDDDKDDD
jgi:HD-GYP domain-containing protein (c-di-GMP phosphodiesterase class II)